MLGFRRLGGLGGFSRQDHRGRCRGGRMSGGFGIDNGCLSKRRRQGKAQESEDIEAAGANARHNNQQARGSWQDLESIDVGAK